MQMELEKFCKMSMISSVFCPKRTKGKCRSSFFWNLTHIALYIAIFFLQFFLPKDITAQIEAKSVTISAYLIDHVFLPGDTTAVVGLTFTAISGNAKIASISVIRTGTADDADVPNVYIFEDTDQDGKPDGQAISTAVFSGGLATMDGMKNNALATTTDWIICLEIDSIANTSHTAGLTIEASGIIGSGGTIVTFNGFVGSDSSLPVILSSFRVYYSGKGARLFWTTESEIENFSWVIERKTLTEDEYNLIREGEMIIKEAIKPFYIIGQLDGQGTVNTRTEYEFNDNNIREGEYYAYRLADISFSGEVTYHPATLALPMEIPQNYELYQNYPNPFNPATVIRYLVPVDSRVTMKIYTIAGQKVITLLDKDIPAGIYDLTWKGTAENGQKVASGTYIYLMKALSQDGGKQFTSSRKMILVR
jgi:hypothetical protein